MLTCSKTYRDIPLSHRQPNHPGRCSRLHGHSWSITITFASKELDSNGFVVDFGELHYIADWIDQHLDHGTIICANDPRVEDIRQLAESGLLKILEINQASCEGIAQHLFSTFDQLVRTNTRDRAWIKKIYLEEDSRNSATFEPDTTRE